MNNLISKYGESWFTNKFNSTFFMHNGEPARVIEADSHGVNIRVVSKNEDGVISSVMRSVSYDTFHDSSVFTVPELGYRHLHDGAYLAFFARRNDSYVRGLSLRNLQPRVSNLTRLLQSRRLGIPAPSHDELNYMALKPDYIPLHTGIRRMLAGELMSFACSSTIAVVPSPTSDTELTILCCGKTVGKVDRNGNLRITSSITNDYIEALTNDQ